jgi:DnaJ-class molecular chaperone
MMAMLDCWYCDGRGKIFKDREAADKGEYSKCRHCSGSGKLHDDADAVSDADE